MQTYTGKFGLTFMRGYFFIFSEQFAGEVIEKIKNKKNKKRFNNFKFKKL